MISSNVFALIITIFSLSNNLIKSSDLEQIEVTDQVGNPFREVYKAVENHFNRLYDQKYWYKNTGIAGLRLTELTNTDVEQDFTVRFKPTNCEREKVLQETGSEKSLACQATTDAVSVRLLMFTCFVTTNDLIN